MTNEKNTKRLAAYSALAAATTVAVTDANAAQVIYDIEDVAVYRRGSVTNSVQWNFLTGNVTDDYVRFIGYTGIDNPSAYDPGNVGFNEIRDYEFNFGNSTLERPFSFRSFFMQGSNLSPVQGVMVNGSNVVKRDSLSAVIDGGDTFYAQDPTFYGDYAGRYVQDLVGASGFGTGPGQQHGIVGFRFQDGGGNTRYGWAEVTYDPNESFDSVNYLDPSYQPDPHFILHGFGYEDTGLGATPGGVSTVGDLPDIPEPSSLVLLAAGAVGLAGFRDRKRKE